MGRWILLFRGINVGGNNILRMADLKHDLASLGYSNIQTYIQSGNAVLDAKDTDAAKVEKAVTNLIAQRHGFRPRLLVRSPSDLEAALAANPFQEAHDEPRSLHFFFLANPATAPDKARMQELQAPSERTHLTPDVFYLHAPDGLGRSKLAANVEKLLGVPTTARNFRTVLKLHELASSPEATAP